MKNYLIIIILALACSQLEAQISAGQVSGSFQANGNFFIEDKEIDATNTPQYDHELYGADAWLQLNYNSNQYGLDMGIRFDLFNNSNLLNPQGSYTDEGIGRWYIRKKMNKLTISGGYLYDQIGSGIIFRAYEERPLLIDNALFGVRATYELTEDWKIKAFTGRQKVQFNTYDAIIKGFSAEGFVSTGEESGITLAPGFGVVNRTLDDEVMNNVISSVSTYELVDSIAPQYNTYAFTAYNNLSAGKFNWYVEGALKTEDVFVDPFAERTNTDGSKTLGKLVNESGSILYSSLSYAGNGLGVTLEVKRTENFTYRTNPFVSLNRGTINFLPPMTRFNTYRLTTRYNAATQELGEIAIQADIRYKINKKLSFNTNFSNITNLDDKLLYREILGEVLYKYKRKWQLVAGLQLQEYNQEVYETKPNVPNVETITPYVDFLYKIDRKKAIRIEMQYMDTDQDFGSWLFGLAEYTMAPHWSFTVSDMYNIDPKKTDKLHYPRFDVYYTFKANRFSLSYVKQVEGVVCSGGICRLEPAFSGVKLTLNSTF